MKFHYPCTTLSCNQIGMIKSVSKQLFENGTAHFLCERGMDGQIQDSESRMTIRIKLASLSQRWLRTLIGRLLTVGSVV